MIKAFKSLPTRVILLAAFCGFWLGTAKAEILDDQLETSDEEAADLEYGEEHQDLTGASDSRIAIDIPNNALEWNGQIYTVGRLDRAREEAAKARDSYVVGPKGQHYRTGLLRLPHGLGVTYFQPSPESQRNLPDEYDARVAGRVPPIKDQGNCGSCYAFAMTKALESQIMSTGSPYLDLSEQDWIANARDSYGCNGGFMDASFAVKTGLASEKDCPYKANDRVACRAPKAAKAKNWGFVGKDGKPTDTEAKAALIQYGVLPATIAANSLGSTPSSGVVTSCRSTSINHMVAASGYKKNGDWIVANSWTADFGDHGFFYIKTGCNKWFTTSGSLMYVAFEGGPAPQPPQVQLPVDITIYKGSGVLLGVQAEAGVSYRWNNGIEGSTLFVVPTVDTVYTLAGTNAAGTASSSVKVKVITGPGGFE